MGSRILSTYIFTPIGVLVTAIWLGLVAGCSQNPQEVLNDFNNLMFAANGEVQAPVDVDPKPVANRTPVASDNPATLPDENLSAGMVSETANSIALDEDMIGAVLALSDRGSLSAVDGESGVFRVACAGFEMATVAQQKDQDECWLACVQMLDQYEFGQARCREEIMTLARGEQAAKDDTVLNYANIYEIIRALNPELAGYGQEIAYFATSALALDGASSDDQVGYGLLMAHRYLQQYMGAEDILASLAKGQPVILGTNWPIAPQNSDGQHATFNHAVVIHAAEFVAIPSDLSSEQEIESVAKTVDAVVTSRDLWSMHGALKENTTMWERAVSLGAGIGSGIKKSWHNFRTRNKINRPYRLAIRRVELADPIAGFRSEHLDYTDLDALTYVKGTDLHHNFIYAINRARAKEIIPITDQQELDAVLKAKTQ